MFLTIISFLSDFCPNTIFTKLKITNFAQDCYIHSPKYKV